MSTPTTRDNGESPRASGASAPVGEGPAWIREHLDAVLRFARRRLSSTDAEDVAAESFEALFSAQHEGRAPDAPGAYLLGVARRRIAERLRRRAQGREPVALPAGWQGFCDTPLPEDVLAGRELAELVHVALGLLGGPERALLLARYREGVSVAALALRLAATPKAIELRLYRARAALRDLLRAAGETWEEPLPLGSLARQEEGPR